MPEPEATPTPSLGTPGGLLAEVCDALDAELAALDAEGWSTPVLNDRTVRDLVIHLTVINDALVDRLRDADPTPVTRATLLEITDTPRRSLRALSHIETLEAWRRSVAHLQKCVVGVNTVGWMGLSISTSDVIVERAFETWILANDIRNAIGRASLDPSAQHLRVLCELAVQMLPLALAANGCTHAGNLQVSLGGPGGGEWTIPLGGEASDSTVLLCAAARDLCLLMGQRIDPLDFAYTARGDEAAATVAHDVVVAAAAFARW